MACPEPSLLSAFCDAAASATDEREVAAHLERCPRCRSTVAEERRLKQALATLVCPEPETLARFVDEVLPAGKLEQVAAHVLRCEPCREGRRRRWSS